MNKIIVLALLFVFSTCRLNMKDCSTTSGPTLYVDTTSGNYQYNWDFDWTDDDSISFKVPFTESSESFGENDIIPFFINASTVSDYGSKSYEYVSQDDVNNDITKTKTLFEDLSAQLIYNKYQVFYPFDYSINGKLLTATIKGDEFKANPNDVNQKFIKYFGWAVCSGTNKKVQVTVSNILVTFNNGNYFSISKILLATLALLFL